MSRRPSGVVPGGGRGGASQAQLGHIGDLPGDYLAVEGIRNDDPCPFPPDEAEIHDVLEIFIRNELNAFRLALSGDHTYSFRKAR